MLQALLKEVRDLPGEDVDTDFPQDQGQIPSVDVNDRTRVNGIFKHLLRWLLIFLCLWASFSSLSDNALEILITFLRATFHCAVPKVSPYTSQATGTGQIQIF